MRQEDRKSVINDGMRAALWDLDGTILDSRQAHWRAWRGFTEAQGKPVTYKFFNDTFGFRNEVILRLHFGEQLTDADVARLADGKETRFRATLLEGGVEPLPGVREWLAGLAAAGWRQALASMAPRENIAVTLGALGIRNTFDTVVSGDDVRRGKPDPDVFLAAAAALGVPPERCVVIEDSPQGVEAARRAGMKCIAVGPESARLGADLALRSLAEASPRVAADLLNLSQPLSAD